MFSPEGWQLFARRSAAKPWSANDQPRDEGAELKKCWIISPEWFILTAS